MATETILIRVVQQGVDRVVSKMDRIARAAERGADAQRLLNRALQVLGGAAIVRGAVRLADANLRIANSLAVVTESTAEVNAITDELFEVSNRARSSFELNAELYRRLALSTSELGTSQEQLLRVTELVNKAIIISGSTAREAEAGLIQLSQGLAAGALRGDELRSVLEQLPFVTQVIQDSLGLTRGELRDFGAQGGITAQVILDAFEENADRINELFEKTTPTIAQSLTVLRNNAIGLIRDFERSTGVTQKTAALILALAENLDEVAKFAVVAGTTLSTILVQRGLNQAISAVKALTLAVAANPLGALLVAVTTISAALLAFNGDLLVSTDGLATVRDVGLATFEAIQETISNVILVTTEFAKSLGITLPDNLGELLVETASFADRFVGFFVGSFNVIENGLKAIIDAPKVALAGLSAVATTVGQTARMVINSILTAFQNASASIQSALTGNFEQAAQLAQNAVDSLVVGIDVALSSSGDRLSKNFADNLSEVDFASSGKSAGELFFDGFNQSNITDAVQGILDRAEEIAQERAARGDGPEVDLTGVRGGPDEEKALARTLGFLVQIGEQLRSEESLLRMTNSEREVELELRKILAQAQKDQITLTDTEVEGIRGQLEALQQLQVQADILESINGPAETYAMQLEAINAILKESPELTKPAIDALTDLRIAYLDTQTDFASGFERGFLKIQKQTMDYASQAETLLTTAFNSATDALLEFAETGEFNFRKFASAVVKELLRIAAQQLILSLIPGGAGAAGAVAGAVGGAASGGGKQAGGSVQSGQPVVVGEQGPELFVPPTGGGNILPTKDTADVLTGGGRQPVNVTVVNVESDDRVAQAMDTPQGEEVIMNTIRKNRRGVRQVLG